MNTAMNVLKRCDQFGSSFELNFRGQPDYQTQCGGLVSFLIRVFVFTFASIQFVSLIDYKDPQISSFSILEDRNKMTEPLNLADQLTRFYFGVYDLDYFYYKNLDPRLGHFVMTLLKQTSDKTTGRMNNEQIDIPVYEMSDDEKAELNIEIHQTLYTVDHQQLLVSGAKNQEHFIGFRLELKLCSSKSRLDCASDEQI